MGTIKADLQLAAAYPATSSSSVRFIETHISFVFVVGAEVYKVKRPVNLGFLDFRDVARRKEACEAELRLNARLAPHTYLGVVPVRRRADGFHHLGTSGDIVDHAVHMVC